MEKLKGLIWCEYKKEEKSVVELREIEMEEE
jgi:hypothetical protein